VFVQLQNEIFMCGHLKYEGHRAFSFFLLPASVARMLRYELHCLCQTRDWLCLVCCSLSVVQRGCPSTYFPYWVLVGSSASKVPIPSI